MKLIDVLDEERVHQIDPWFGEQIEDFNYKHYWMLSAQRYEWDELSPSFNGGCLLLMSAREMVPGKVLGHPDYSYPMEFHAEKAIQSWVEPWMLRAIIIDMIRSIEERVGSYWLRLPEELGQLGEKDG